VTFELRRQPGVLDEQRLMSVSPTPLRHGDQRAGKPALGRRLPHHVLAPLRFHPGVGEAEKVERGFLAVWMRATASLRAEVDEARLVGMQREPMPFKPFPQHFQHPLSVAVVLEGHHEVIGKSHQGTASRQARPHLVLEPLVQHMVQVDVREHG